MRAFFDCSKLRTPSTDQLGDDTVPSYVHHPLVSWGDDVCNFKNCNVVVFLETKNKKRLDTTIAFRKVYEKLLFTAMGFEPATLTLPFAFPCDCVVGLVSM